MPWEAITYVSTGLTLLAFIVATVAWAAKVQTEEKRKLIDSASDEAKASLVDKALDLIHVDTTGLSGDKRYKLAMELIKRRAERFRIIAIVICVFALTGGGVSIYSNSKVVDDLSPLEPFIREVHKMQAIAAAMQSGPLEKVREVSSRAPKLAEDILSVNGISKTSHKIDQNRYAATAFLFASDATHSKDKQDRFAERTIELVKKGMELISVAKSSDVALSQKLSQLNYMDKLRHLYLEATLTLAINGKDSYQNKYKSLVSEFDTEYFRRNIGDNYEAQRTQKLVSIRKLWEGE